jgi:hypothetical protein
VIAALNIFAADGDPKDHRAYVNLFKIFRYGEMARLCRDALAGGPMTTAQLTQKVMAVKGLDVADRQMVQSVTYSVLHSMRGMRGRRVVDRTKAHNRCLWRLTSADGAASSLSTGAKPAIALLTSQSP